MSEIYARSQKELEKKTADFWAAFERKDNAKKKLVESGKMSDAEYKRWRIGQIMTGKHWEEMTKQVAQEMINADKTAIAYVNGKLPEIYALNYNAFADQTAGLKGYSFELVDANTVKNLATSDKTLLPYKTIDQKKVERWNTQKVNAEVMQGIIQGESVKKIAKRLENVVGMEKNSAIRNARTSTTSAENKGRMDSYHEARNMGIVMKKKWLSLHDHRTRDWHGDLDGVEKDIDEPFENVIRLSKTKRAPDRIMYPGDPDAHPANVYNCRCTLVSDIKGFRSATTGKINYFIEATDRHKVVEGKDISGSWERRADKFDFEIEDVINAQGFDGLPKVVSAEEFNALKQESVVSGYRGYSAPNKEALDAYKNQLYYGDWYVDCHVGTAVYGQGMYMQGYYNGTTNSDQADAFSKMIAEGYGKSRSGDVYRVENMLLDKSANGVWLYDRSTDDPLLKYSDFYREWMNIQMNNPELYKKMGQDIGVFAASKGYDYISVSKLEDFTGDKFRSDEFVVLNRTKLIIKGD